MKQFKIYLFAAILAVGFTACSDDDPDFVDINDAEIEAMSMSPQWINYMEAVSSELYGDAVKLWAAWNGPAGLTAEELEIVGNNFFAKYNDDDGIAIDITNGFAASLKNAGKPGSIYETQRDVIEIIIADGCQNIASEVGTQKIAGPYGFAINNNMRQAVLEVESWYSWNSITDYSDNIISIKNTYFGRIGKISAPANSNSISAFVKSQNPELDQEVTEAIDNAYNAIQSMTIPFRNNLTENQVKVAITTCADLDIAFQDVYKLLDGTQYDFTNIIANYADNVVLPTYVDMKAKCKATYEAVKAINANKTQANVNKACLAWRASRIPWEQSEAILFGPADVLNLDPQLDSWPLDQADIKTILKDPKLTTVDNYINAITEESIRGYHTLELLLFNNGENRTVSE